MFCFNRPILQEILESENKVKYQFLKRFRFHRFFKFCAQFLSSMQDMTKAFKTGQII